MRNRTTVHIYPDSVRAETANQQDNVQTVAFLDESQSCAESRDEVGEAS